MAGKSSSSSSSLRVQHTPGTTHTWKLALCPAKKLVVFWDEAPQLQEFRGAGGPVAAGEALGKQSQSGGSRKGASSPHPKSGRKISGGILCLGVQGT